MPELGSIRDRAARLEFFRMLYMRKGVQALYDAIYPLYNQFYFDGLMVKPEFRLNERNDPDLWACYHHPDDELDATFISLHPDQVGAGYECFRDTLLHEMCHQYQRQVLKDIGPSHGPVWMELAKALNLRTEDYESA